MPVTRDHRGCDVDLQALAAQPLRAGPTVRLGKGSGAQGYAAAPGSGPKGETCGTCRWKSGNQKARVYLKCGHYLAPRHTGGPKTDIRARSPACRYWETVSNPIQRERV